MIDPGIIVHAVNHVASSAPGGGNAGITNDQHTQTIQLEWAILTGVLATLGGLAHMVYRTGKVMQKIENLAERVVRLETWRDNK